MRIRYETAKRSFLENWQLNLFSSRSKDAIVSQFESNGSPNAVVKSESERISKALEQSRPDRLAEDGGSYSQGDLFAPE